MKPSCFYIVCNILCIIAQTGRRKTEFCVKIFQIISICVILHMINRKNIPDVCDGCLKQTMAIANG